MTGVDPLGAVSHRFNFIIIIIIIIIIINNNNNNLTTHSTRNGIWDYFIRCKATLSPHISLLAPLWEGAGLMQYNVGSLILIFKVALRSSPTTRASFSIVRKEHGRSESGS